MNNLAIKNFQIKNYKAIQDSGIVELEPLTVFIGNNGSGKSSFIEGLETYQTIIKHGLDTAMNRWRGYEHLRNKMTTHDLETSEDGTYESNPMGFKLCRQMNGSTFCADMAVTLDQEKELLIQNEKLAFDETLMVERKANNAFYFSEVDSFDFSAPASNEFSILSKANSALWAALSRYIKSMGDSFTTTKLMQWLENVNKNKKFWDSFDWQFIALNPDNMLAPTGQKRISRKVQLNKDGSNIAKYLLAIRKQNPVVFKGILETLQRILPYAQNLQVVLSTELERNVYMELTEGECKIADWLLSTGTLRIVALLALLRHPNPPPLIVIEEIENGLDPRTIRLMVEEICKIIKAGKTQIILTTHSPYFLDLLQPEQVVLVERDATGQPTFNKVAEQSKLQQWTKHFMPTNNYG
ncbi:ATP-binding protein [Thiotrichales bacterium HSG1]|nr:ATP-binding protein [Thiotrichales bacterium HSG1]